MNETITNGSNLKFIFSFSKDAKMAIEKKKNLRDSFDCFAIILSCSLLSKTAIVKFRYSRLSLLSKFAASVAR